MIWYFFPEVNRVLIMNLIMKRVPTSCSMFCIKFSIFSIVSVQRLCRYSQPVQCGGARWNDEVF